ncbi:ACP S-malonyltransferase [Microbacterium sp. ABRD28]|uniref:ACP S-malonyltransferase n=1 Tax=Microbacterium sp. ABRD28 TaxID=2268461 RepID=UPI000F559A7F|nr:ACP S-malonyltransferase [Microbacterium sp. ABRD28]AZC14033.1 ACP S-malonyltransferase [Microbacterium sp. ABRD28]
MIIAVFPGQGSQTPGFLAPWLEIPGARETLEVYSDAAGVDLVAAGTEWDADRIRDTKVAQPLIVAAGLLAWGELGRPRQVAGVAGHSVGEFTAAAAAAILPDAEVLRLVGVRGRAMADAAAQADTGMSAVIGGDEAAVLERLASLGLTPANHNGAGQIVAAGARADLDRLSAEPVAGTRVIPLQVAGAFHTDYMAPAVATLRDAAAQTVGGDPLRTIWTNRDGSAVATGRAFIDLLVEQVASPVRWDLCMSSFAAAGVTGLIELTPAGTLTGLAKRALRGIPTVAVKTPDDLATAVELWEGSAA